MQPGQPTVESPFEDFDDCCLVSEGERHSPGDDLDIVVAGHRRAVGPVDLWIADGSGEPCAAGAEDEAIYCYRLAGLVAPGGDGGRHRFGQRSLISERRLTRQTRERVNP